MAPGRDELAEDRMLVGGSGRLFWSILGRRASITRDMCYCLNVIGEWPEGKNGGPAPEQLAKWWDIFNTNIAESQAKVAVVLGGDALSRVMGVSGIEKWRGYLMSRSERQPSTRTKIEVAYYKTSNAARGIKKGDPRQVKVKVSEVCPIPECVQHIIPTLHPAAVLRAGLSPIPAFAADLGRVGRALRNELIPYRSAYEESPVPPLYASQYTAIDCGGAVAFDIETPRTESRYKAIERIGIADAINTWTAPWDAGTKAAASDQLSRASVRVAHNIAFDAPVLRQHGLEIPEPWFDTMLGAAMLQPDLYKGLNSVASLQLDRPRWKHEADDRPAYYNAQDVSATLELYVQQHAMLKKHGMLDFFEGTVMRAVPVLVDMTQRGIPLSEERRLTWVDELRAQSAGALARWLSLSDGVSPASPQQISDFLYGRLGLPKQVNKYGGITSDAAAIKALLSHSEQHRPLLETLLEYRTSSKLLRTYAEVPVDDDGCVHPSWLPAGKDDDSFGKGLAGTWRITSHGPNFQNQPPQSRKLFVPPPGWVFIEADWSQIEARIIQALSGDKNLGDAIRDGLHTTNMRILGLDKTRAKNAFYGWSYGAGKRTLHRTFLAHGFSVPESECAALLRRFEVAYPAVAAWRRAVGEEVAATYSLRNPFGLRRQFFRGSDDTPAALDYLPQSTAAGCMWSVVRPLSDDLKGLGGHIYALVHDSILIGVPESAATEAARLLRAHMERPFDCVAPRFWVPVEMKSGTKSWGELEPCSH